MPSVNLLPARPLVRMSLRLVVPITVIAVLAGVVVGRVAALGVLLGVLGGVASAPLAVSYGLRAVLAILSAVGAWAGVVVAGQPLLAGGLVAAFGLLQAPLSRRSGGVGVALPVLASLGASARLPDAPLALALWLLAGFALVTILARVLVQPMPPNPVDARVARRHAVVAAATTGPVEAIGVTLGISHGYWAVLALSYVLRPVAQETRRFARDRTAGTLVGVCVGVFAVLVLPTWLSMVAAGVFLVLGIAFSLGQDQRGSAWATTPVLLIVGSGGLVGAGVELAAERMLLTAAGAGLAAGAAAFLLRSEGPGQDRRGLGAADSA